MLVTTKARLKFLLAGREQTIEVANPDRYRKGRTYALGITHRRTTCHVEILNIDAEAGALRVKLANVDPPRLLARRSQYGYTDDPAKALRSEPEAVDPAELERINRRYRERHPNENADELARRRARSLTIRAKEATRRSDWRELRDVGAQLVDVAAARGTFTVS